MGRPLRSGWPDIRAYVFPLPSREPGKDNWQWAGRCAAAGQTSARMSSPSLPGRPGRSHHSYHSSPLRSGRPHPCVSHIRRPHPDSRRGQALHASAGRCAAAGRPDLRAYVFLLPFPGAREGVHHSYRSRPLRSGWYYPPYISVFLSFPGRPGRSTHIHITVGRCATVGPTRA